MFFRQNDQLLLATEFVQHTSRNIFLTGRAGTGKTTFLHNLRKITPKRMVVVAPTGVAAINAGGVTIHSFFQLGFGPAIPGSDPHAVNTGRQGDSRPKFNRAKINLVKCIDLLVIDEISMVRADVLDAVDGVLRRYRDARKPFGGVQLLMIGDLHQLSPVIRGEEWQILREYYDSAYFFDSRALKLSDPVTIELKEIFRQTDATFIALLNKVRDQKITAQTMAELNSRHIPGFSPADEEGYITLTTHNAGATEINRLKMDSLPGTSGFFRAEISGEFPVQNFPASEEIELKPGAQVMFLRNDPSPGKLYYNGKIGKITAIGDETVTVQCPGDAEEIEAGAVTWENVRYTLDENSKEIRGDISGTFTQIPLRPAWAITIHKSQGLTFDRVIIDAHAAFASGQVYVALSRCRTFEGIVLSTQVTGQGIKTDPLVMSHSRSMREHEPGPDHLFASKFRYQQELIFELFDLSRLKYRIDNLMKLVKENSAALDPGLAGELQARKERWERELFSVAGKFRPQLEKLMDPARLPGEDPALQERIRQGCTWFAEQLKHGIAHYVNGISTDTDNRETARLLADSLEKLQKELFTRSACLECCLKGFDPIAYLRARSSADVDFRPAGKAAAGSPAGPAANVPHPLLFQALRQWRNSLADDHNLPAYMILPQRALRELADKLPVTMRQLKSVKGIGQVRIREYGEVIIGIIRDYCTGNGIGLVQEEISELPEKKENPARKKTEKGSSGRVSLELFQAGKDISTIAAERHLAVSTILSHLAPHVATGDLNIGDLVAKEKLDTVTRYLDNHPGKTAGEIRAALGEEISYAELNMILLYGRK